MEEHNDKSLIIRLQEELEKRKISVPKFEEQTGIPKDRVYKWLKRSTGKIDYADALAVENWLAGKLDRFPGETSKSALLNISESSKQAAEAFLLSQKNIEKMLAMLEKVSAYEGMYLGGEETPHGENLDDKKKTGSK